VSSELMLISSIWNKYWPDLLYYTNDWSATEHRRARYNVLAA